MNMHTASLSPFVDLGLSRNDLESYLRQSGYWKNEEMKRRYLYHLSPSALLVSSRERESLERLATTTYAAVLSLADRIASIGMKKSPSSHDEGRLVSLARRAARGLLLPEDGVRDIPPVIKVDLVRDPRGNYGIAEIDVFNPRGLGFVALLEGGVPVGMRSNRFPGMKGVAGLLGESHSVLVSEFERFYEPSFRIYADMMKADFGVDVRVLRASDFSPGGVGEREDTLLTIPDTLDANPEVRERLLEKYRRGALKALFPPLAYLGSKAFLPYLRAYPGMQEFIPPTGLVGRKCGGTLNEIDLTKPLVLKAAVSSGLKKVVFSDIDPSFSAMLEDARKQRHPSWILQEQVPQEPLPVVVFDEHGQRETRDYFLRVTAYVAASGIVDVEVTGRPDRKVHGAPDCIMLPVLLA